MRIHVRRHHRFRVLQLVSECHKDRLNVVRLCVVLGRCLKQRHLVRVGKALSRAGAHRYPVSDVTLVADENARDVLAQIVGAAFLNPARQALKRRHFGDVVHEDDRVDISIVMLDHALAESLLPCSVPDLKLSKENNVG